MYKHYLLLIKGEKKNIRINMQQNYHFNFIASNKSYNLNLCSITIYVTRESLEKLRPPWLMDL